MSQKYLQSFILQEAGLTFFLNLCFLLVIFEKELLFLAIGEKKSMKRFVVAVRDFKLILIQSQLHRNNQT